MNSECPSKLSLLLTLPPLMEGLSDILLGFSNQVMVSGIITNGQDLFPSLRSYLISGSKPFAPVFSTPLTILSHAASSAISGLDPSPPCPFKTVGTGFGAMILTDSTTKLLLGGKLGSLMLDIAPTAGTNYLNFPFCPPSRRPPSIFFLLLSVAPW